MTPLAWLIGSKVGRYAAIAFIAFALAGAFIAWQRADAVRDARRDAEKKAHEISREIENETRNDTDDALLDCLRGRGC